MGPDRLSIIAALVGTVAGLAAMAAFRPSRRKRWAALGAGAAVTAADILGAWAAGRLDLWHLHGAWSFAGVPLVLNLTWIFLAGSYVLAYDNLGRLPHPRLARAMFVPGAAVAGVGNDAFFQSLGILTLGQGMRIAYTFPYWLGCIGLGLVAYYGLKGRSRGSSPT